MRGLDPETPSSRLTVLTEVISSEDKGTERDVVAPQGNLDHGAGKKCEQQIREQCFREEDDDKKSMLHLPMNQNAAARLDSTLNEFVTFWKMLKQIFVFDIVYFNSFVDEAVKEALFHR